jgi:hypothetical protein
MHHPMRVILSVGVVAILLAGAGAGVTSLDWVDFQVFQPDDGRAERLDADLCIVKRHCDAKEKIIKEMIGDRMTMLEAAACFRQVEISLHLEPRPRAEWNVHSDEEYFCRQVICFLEARAPARARQCEREVPELLAQGTLRFPAEAETIRRLEGFDP